MEPSGLVNRLIMDPKDYRKEFVFNGELIGPQRLPDLDAAWKRPIIEFLKNWYDESEYVELTSSGSTGTPKMIRLAKSTMLESARFTNRFFNLKAKDPALLCLPANFIAGKMMLVRAIAGDLSLFAIPPASTILFELPLAFTALTPHQLEKTLTVNPAFFSRTKYAIIGGGSISHKMEHKLKDLSCRMFSSYGMTETSSHIALRPLNGPEATNRYQLIDDSIRIETGKKGNLIIKAPYLGINPIVTRDVVTLLDQRSFLWSGRLDNMINSGGIKIFPEILESKLEGDIPNRLFFFGESDDIYQQRVALLIESPTPPNLESILPVLREKLNRFELPVRIYYSPQFTETSNGKVHRKKSLKNITMIYEKSGK